MLRAKDIRTVEALAETLSTTLGFEVTAIGSQYGNTLVPPPLSANTDVRGIIAALPRIRTDTTQGDPPDLRLGHALGQGGMGIVRAAEQVPLGREVAVKAPRAEVESERATLQILREAWLTGWLEHPNVIPIYTLGTDGEGRPLIVMKKIDGTPWSKYLRGEAVPEGDRDPLDWHLQILMQVCNAVQFAASRGIVHRDLKPDNIMIGRFGEVYVLDWGIAVSLRDDANGRLPLARDARGIAGTPGYMAPEMVDEDGASLSERTDVYLLGAILHEVITGKLRHHGANLVEALFSSVRSDPYDYGPSVAAELGSIANKAMSREAEGRFPSAEAMRLAIGDFLRHRSSAVLSKETLTRLEALKATLASEERIETSVYNALGECRFGFTQALKTWPENREARAGLTEALELTAEYEIARGSLAAVSVLVAELGDRAKPDLLAKVEKLRREALDKEQEVAKLKKLSADRDLDIGRRTRSFLALMNAIHWCTLGVGFGVAKSMGMKPSYGWYFVAFGVLTLEVLGGVYWARYSLFRTSVNRQLVAAVCVFGPLALLTKLAGIILGLSLETTIVFDLVVLATVTAMAGITVERRLSAASIAYVGGFLYGCFDVEHVFFASGIASFLAFLVPAYIWRPKSWADLRRPVQSQTKG